MPPHGPGMYGAAHSHNPEYPDDDWNLYAMLAENTTALNVTKPSDAIGIFKPHVLRLTDLPELISDADAEIIVIARFTAPVHVRKIIVVGGGEEGHHPSVLKCFANRDDIDFGNVEAVKPSQRFDLPINAHGTVELITPAAPFTNITSLTFYFPSNHGDLETTNLRYIGMQGEHTHYRREAVDAEYEVLCTGHDIKQPEAEKGAHGMEWH